MFRAITSFELRYHLRAPLFYILLVVFFLLTFGAVTSDGIQIGGSVGNVNRNSPFVIMQFLLVMSIFGVLTTTAFVANSVHRDFDLNTDSLFFSTPVSKWQYLGGRFLGSFVVSVMVYLGVIGAVMIGSLMPWIEKERLGPFELWPYVYSLFVLVTPNLLLCGAIFFAIAALTRSMMATYSGVVGFFVAYGIAGTLLRDVENERLGALLDPFGFGAFSVATQYWTVFDRNTSLMPLSGVFLWNRILWMSVALVILGIAFWKFRFAVGARKSKKVKAEPEAEPMHGPAALPQVAQTFGAGATLRTFLATVRLEMLGVFKSIPFIIIMLLGVFNIWGGSSGASQIFGTDGYPLTQIMVEVIDGNFVLFALIIAAFYAGELAWRERTLKMNEVYDATPAPTWTIWAAKLSALIAVVFSTLLAATATTILIQLANGYSNLELPLYVKGVFLERGTWLVMVTIFAFFFQVLTNQKYVGFLAVVLYLIISNVLPALDYEHRLYRFSSAPPAPYSDMNGYGHFVAPLTWFTTYWLLLCAVLVVIAHLFWVRGTDGGMRQRWQIARQRFGRPAFAMLALFGVAFISTGCYIFYNTNVLNTYRTSDQNEKRSADTEKKYKKYERIPQPRITDIQASVDIYPEKRAVEIRGSYAMVNRTGAPIAELHVLNDPDLTTHEVMIPGAKPKMADAALGYTIYELGQPLAPGASMTMTFRTSFAAKGFTNDLGNTNIVENGTFFNDFNYFPHLGYQSFGELQDRNTRRKYGLQPIERMRPPSDMKARMDSQLSREADWINLDTTVSTSPDQIAIAPGYLQREWTANGRRYFHYKTDAPILAFWSYLSARYQVKRGQWKDVPIEVYYDAKHPYNVDRMIYSVQKSLDYFTTQFSPYQHRQVRILEFPGYARFAQSFPNTIPYSERIGFVADLRKKENIDYVFYVTAHEVAHQWWAHQVIGGDVQGATMIVETMAQYSALMVMEKEYGRDQMRRFLRYELDRYLEGRGGELVAEMPLMLVENQQYVHYRKGSLAMYALRDAIGEDKVNLALRRFLAKHAFKAGPYPTATDLVDEFRAVTPPERRSMIHDLFETITLYDNRAKDVKVTNLPAGKYRVTFTVEAKKLRASGSGEEKEIPIDDWIDIGVLGEKSKEPKEEKVLLLEKRHITNAQTTIEVVVNEKPVKAGIDPLNKLIDRNPGDNTKAE